MVNTQKVTILWHKYPEVKPKETGIYSVKLIDNVITIGFWTGSEWFTIAGDVRVKGWRNGK